MVVTIRDVARIAGVSVGTVSRALNSYPDVKEETRQRVLEVAEQLNYKPNGVARSLVAGKSSTIGVVVPNILISFWPQVLKGIQDALQSVDYTMLLYSYEDTEADNAGKYLRMLVEKKVDGVIFGPIHEKHCVREVNQVLDADTPVVTVARRLDISGIPFVMADGFVGGMLAADYLLDIGTKHVICAGHEMTVVSGFKAQITSRRLDVNKTFTYINAFGAEAGFRLGEQLAQQRHLPDAVFAHDMTAIGILKALAKHSIRVPEDISVMGYDDLEISSLIYPSLTTISQPKYEQGNIGARILLEMIDKKTVVGSRIIEPKLVVRESCAVRTSL